MIHIIFICTGNICRSPMAEGILRARFESRGRQDIRISSMGIHGLVDQAASANAIEICHEHNIDISHHRSRPLIVDELAEADMVFTMEQGQKQFICLFFQQVSDRVFQLAAWPDREKRRNDIRDPMGKSKRKYAEIFSQIEYHIDRIFPALEEIFPGRNDNPLFTG